MARKTGVNAWKTLGSYHAKQQVTGSVTRPKRLNRRPDTEEVTDDILAEHPDLTTEDIHESLLYAAEAVRERELPLRHTA
jgi:uncharacterized protein (DUF433 family)